jgi:hypothetical protein
VPGCRNKPISRAGPERESILRPVPKRGAHKQKAPKTPQFAWPAPAANRHRVTSSACWVVLVPAPPAWNNQPRSQQLWSLGTGRSVESLVPSPAPPIAWPSRPCPAHPPCPPSRNLSTGITHPEKWNTDEKRRVGRDIKPDRALVLLTWLYTSSHWGRPTADLLPKYSLSAPPCQDIFASFRGQIGRPPGWPLN